MFLLMTTSGTIRHKIISNSNENPKLKTEYTAVTDTEFDRCSQN